MPSIKGSSVYIGSVVCALDNNPDKLYWVEARITGNQSTTLTAGQFVQYVDLFGFDNTAVVGVSALGSWATIFMNDDSAGGGGNTSVGVASPLNAGEPAMDVQNSFFLTITSGIVDPSTAEIIGLATDPLGVGNLVSGCSSLKPSPPAPPPPPATVARATFISNPPTNIAVAQWGAYGGFTDIGAPSIVFSGAQQIRNNGATAGLSRQKDFTSYLYIGNGGVLENFQRVMYKDSKGNRVNGVFTNSRTLEILISLFMMKSVKGGLAIAGNVVTPVTSTDGLAFTANFDPTKFLKVSPGQPDPTIIYLTQFVSTELVAVSTL